MNIKRDKWVFVEKVDEEMRNFIILLLQKAGFEISHIAEWDWPEAKSLGITNNGFGKEHYKVQCCGINYMREEIKYTLSCRQLINALYEEIQYKERSLDMHN